MTPTEIRLRNNSKLLVVAFEDGSEYSFSFEYLRVHSPSAEVVGHGPICMNWAKTWRPTGSATSTASRRQGMLAKSPNNSPS